jgi:hypothetical protein
MTGEREEAGNSVQRQSPNTKRVADTGAHISAYLGDCGLRASLADAKREYTRAVCFVGRCDAEMLASSDATIAF